MAYQSVFKRYELKYLLTDEQREAVYRAIAPYMALDQYGRTTIRNIYFDTDNHRLIRRSLERPAYKEKLRIRSYQQATPESHVFVEVKKKYDSVVYKRRVSLPEAEAMQWVCSGQPCGKQTQISKEIDYFMQYYQPLKPKLFLSYQREAFLTKEASDFRVTFDDTILCRQTDLSLQSEAYGDAILPKGMSLMELKCAGGIPLWMTEILSKHHLYKTSFSKYGTAYQTIIYPKLREKHTNHSEEVAVYE